MAIPSPTPRSRFRDAGAGALGAVAGAARVRAALQVTRVAGWPVCALCRRRRGVLRALTHLMFWGGLAAFLGGFAVPVATGQTGQAHPAFLVSILAGLASMLGSAIALTLGQPARIARLRTTPDGTAVRFSSPHPEFARQLRAILGDRWSAG